MSWTTCALSRCWSWTTSNALRRRSPSGRTNATPQRLLAREVTRLVHGDDAVASAERITAALFHGDIRTLGRADFSQLEQDGMDLTRLAPGTGLLAALTAAGLAKSNAAARRLVDGNGVRLNGASVTDPGVRLDAASALYGRYHVVSPWSQELAPHRSGGVNWHAETPREQAFGAPVMEEIVVDKARSGRMIRTPWPGGRVSVAAL